MNTIDSDFADQDAIIRYLEEKYGSDKVCRVLNFSYITPKVAIKDVGDLFGYPYKIREEVSKLFESKNFDKDYNENIDKMNKYLEENPEYEEWFDVARNISGKIRQASTHACAVGILNESVTNVMPLQYDEKGQKIIQCDMKIVEMLGVVKFDILGVKTLKVVYDTLELIGKDISYLDLDDEEFLSNDKAYKIISDGNTDGLFQIESYGMTELFQKIDARNINELSDGISLYRPDAMSYIPNYLMVKKEEKEAEYIHEDMKPILSETYGALIYQEQVLNIIRKFGGRTYGGADIVRRGLGKKIKEIVHAEAEKLKDEITKTGYSQEVSEYITNYLLEAGNYSFNKSHGVGYATLVYKTAYLKANHTIEYMCSLLNSELGDFANINKYIVNCKQMGISVTPPDINLSDRYFTIRDGKILFGLEMIKGIGDSTVSSILEERVKGQFTSDEDFISRVNVGKSTMIALIKSGCFGKDKMSILKRYFGKTYQKRTFIPLKTTSGYTIKKLEEELNIITKNKEERLRLFNIFKEKEFIIKEKERLERERKSFFEKYMQGKDKWEFNTLSLYLTYNPLEEGLRRIRPFEQYENGDKVTAIGTIIKIEKKKGKNGQFAFIDFYDGNKNIELVFWNYSWSKYMDKLKNGMDIAVIGVKEENKIIVSKAKPYASWLKEKK